MPSERVEGCLAFSAQTRFDREIRRPVQKYYVYNLSSNVLGSDED